MEFYDAIAGRYDDMTGAEARLETGKAHVRGLLARTSAQSALDVACGTGVFTVLLEEVGVKATGVDSSELMLDAARRRAESHGVSPAWVQGTMQDLRKCVNEKHDVILCLGNSLPHLLTEADLKATLSGFSSLLNPEGTLVLQLINYALVLARKERIVSITRRDKREYVRFYDFPPGRHIQFNILELDWEEQRCRHRLHSTRLYPYTRKELTAALDSHGFSHFEVYRDFQFQPFDEEADPSLLLLCRRA